MLAALDIGIEGELLDLRATNGGVQVVVQAGAPGLAEEGRRIALQLAGAHRLETAGFGVATIEQAIDVLLDIALAATNGLRVAKQEENSGARFQLAAGYGADQAVQQLDGCGLVAVHPGRKQQVEPTVLGGGRGDVQRPLTQPVQAHAPGRQLDLLGRLAAGEGQFEQFAEG
ncbi:hypothetical protein D3C85_805490 [compost metagenome]